MTLIIIQSGVKLSLHNFFFSGQEVFQTTMGALGKMFAEAAFTTVCLYTTELFPTVMRSVNYLNYRAFILHIYKHEIYPEAFSKKFTETY